MPLAQTSGPVGHYNVSATATHTLITSASADIYSGWSGQFKLSSVECRPPLDPCTAFPERTVIVIDTLLGNPALPPLVAVSSVIPVNIAAGTYMVTLGSFDDHIGHPGQNQLFERWHAVFTNAGGTLATTADIADLPEEPTTSP